MWFEGFCQCKRKVSYFILFSDSYRRYKGKGLSAEEAEACGCPEGLLREAASACHASIYWRVVRVKFEGLLLIVRLA